jgi:hypothetical protein
MEDLKMKTDIKMKLKKRIVPLGADSKVSSMVSFMVSRLCASDWINGFANFSICQPTH